MLFTFIKLYTCIILFTFWFFQFGAPQFFFIINCSNSDFKKVKNTLLAYRSSPNPTHKISPNIIRGNNAVGSRIWTVDNGSPAQAVFHFPCITLGFHYEDHEKRILRIFYASFGNFCAVTAQIEPFRGTFQQWII